MAGVRGYEPLLTESEDKTPTDSHTKVEENPRIFLLVDSSGQIWC